MLPLEAFDTPTQRKVLRVLAEKHRHYTIEELSELCHRSNSSISRAFQGASRHPFIDVGRVEGSKQKIYGLSTENEYAEPIIELFRIERRRERRGGTIPVDIWNLLEDVTVALADGLSSFVELYLFGSYATGEYHAGSDVDLVLVSRGSREEAKRRAFEILEVSNRSETEVQLLVARYDESEWSVQDAGIESVARHRAPVDDRDPLIALWGDRR